MAKSLHARRYREIPAFLKKLREDAGLTQRELGARLKMRQSLVQKSETAERRVDIGEFIDWATACGHTPYAAFRLLIRFRRGDMDTK